MEVNKNTLAGAMTALGKLICRTSPLAICKSIKIEAEDGTLRLSSCGLNEEVSFELETGGGEVFCCLVRFDEFRDAVKAGRNKNIEVVFDADLLLVGDRYLMTVKDVEWSENRRVKRPQKKQSSILELQILRQVFQLGAVERRQSFQTF